MLVELSELSCLCHHGLYNKPDVGFVGYVAGIFGARPHVPGKKSTATVSSFADGVNMVVESQFRVDVHTEKFS